MPKRTLKPVEQVGVVACLIREQATHVVLITSRGGRNWVLPKGNNEPGMTPKEVAAMEAVEEAGLVGQTVGPPLGHYEYFKNRRIHRVTVYLFVVERMMKKWLEHKERKRRVLPAKVAADEVTDEAVKRLIGHGAERFEQLEALA